MTHNIGYDPKNKAYCPTLNLCDIEWRVLSITSFIQKDVSLNSDIVTEFLWWTVDEESGITNYIWEILDFNLGAWTASDRV